jgi:arylsulfatase A
MARNTKAGRPFFIQLSWNALHAAENIVRGPGVAANSWCHVPIVGSDLFPTFCEWAQVPAAALPADLEGGSIAPLLAQEGRGEVRRPREELVFHFPHYQTGNTPHSAIRLGDLKLLKFYEDDSVQLFDLADDPGERHDLAATMPAEAARLDRYLADVHAQLPAVNPRYDATAPVAQPPGRRGGGTGGMNRGGQAERR